MLRNHYNRESKPPSLVDTKGLKKPSVRSWIRQYVSQSWRLIAILLLGGWGTGHAWESSLFPIDRPMPSGNFDQDAFLQDFSMAGYRGGEAIPQIAGPLHDVTAVPYLADASGVQDATTAIQAAIDAAAAAGGGVVYLPPGTYRVSPQGSANYALRIQQSGVIIRGAGTGKTFLFNASTQMRSKSILLIQGSSSGSLTATGTASSPISADLLTPSTEIPVVDPSLFAVGDWVTVRSDTTNDWINEHQEPEWLNYGSVLGGFAYRRKVLAIRGSRIVLDAPTRYSVKTRDHARLIRNQPQNVSEVGLEDFSIGNRQITGSTWPTYAYQDPSDPGFQAHNSWAIKFLRVRNCWVQRVASYQAVGNTSTAHLLSNGINLNDSQRITLRQCNFQRPQYGGAGGNGYMYRLSNASDNLLDSCHATFSRHGFVFSSMRSSGNVIYRCIDKETKKAVGNSPGGYRTNGSGSDHHMHFSHSNLIDTCTADSSFFTARYRAVGSDPRHLLSAAHSVFWNTEGLGDGGAVVESEQARYGYVIATRGTRSAVSLPTGGGSRMNPPDHVEGEGEGDTLEPFSLYQRQLRRKHHH